ncbi:hypothetical protein QZH56_34435 [Streptomyces olivoreticuli]|uniref:DUF6879 family protein n=1 Tax=Streptomyces olivoreticuli TaxID=68246 RepID=UPI0026584D34|nr:DUF6879 family protein [Streptomyces olivoreticuli]WKK23737.1 hypothetical protein QZH56_34435 [Streptomyces olivoreticuli]
MQQRKQQLATFKELLNSAKHSAVHLEMRDSYAVDYETSGFAAWKAGHRANPDDRESWWRPWLDLVSHAVERGVVMRRARIVSEPVTDYIKFEHSGTFTNIAAGEQVRWLPRRQASDLALPGNDFWVFDDHLVRFNHFTGDGGDAGEEDTKDAGVIRLCQHAFDSVWARGIPHEEYKV